MANRQGEIKTYTWPASSNNSKDINTSGYIVFALVTPATFEPTTIKFQAMDGSGNWADIYDKGNTLITLTISTSRAYDLPAELGSYVQWRLFQTAGGAPAADRTFTIHMKN